MSILAVEGLTRQFKGLRAIQDLSFAVEARSITSIVGPNGAGKSTLFNMISGYLKPTAGRVLFEGREITGKPPHLVCGMGIARAFQIAKPFPELSVEKNVLVAATFGRLGPRDPQATTERAIEICHLTARRNQPASALSIGNLRRLELARAIAARPTLLLADEPCAGLSPAETHRMVEAIRNAVQRLQAAALLIEHDLAAVAALQGEVYVLHQGQLLAQGPLAALQADPAVQAVYAGASK